MKKVITSVKLVNPEIGEAVVDVPVDPDSPMEYLEALAVASNLLASYRNGYNFVVTSVETLSFEEFIERGNSNV